MTQLHFSRHRVAVALLAILLVPFAASGGAQVSRGSIDAVFSSLKSANAPGAAVLVVKDGKPVFQQGYGVTDLHSLRPIDPKTNFRLASLSKQFTATCIMLLVHDGKLRYIGQVIVIAQLAVVHQQ